MAIPTFPALVGVTFPVKRRGPIFDTVVQDAISGKQTAFAKRVTPRWTWELAFDCLRTGTTDGTGTIFAELQNLAGFYAGRFGRLLTFGYRDAADNTATAQPFGTGNGTALTFQLVRTFGGFTEPVFLPTGTISIYKDSALQTQGTDYTIGASGIVTFGAAPGAGVQLTWSGGFNWLCRFDEEGIEFQNFMSGYWSTEKVSFTSVVP